MAGTEPTPESSSQDSGKSRRSPDGAAKRLTFGTIFMRGLAISLPAILTLVILLWAASLLNDYIIQPTSNAVRYVIATVIDQSRPLDDLVTLDQQAPIPYCEKSYRVTKRTRELYNRFLQGYREMRPETMIEIPEQIRTDWVKDNLESVYVVMGTKAVPYYDYALVASQTPLAEMARSPVSLYMDVVTLRHFNGVFHLSAVAVVVIIIAIYFLGRFVTVQVGRYIIVQFESTVIGGLPFVRNVYGSVKQITDFLFSENQLEVRRVVAFEYPKAGIWSVGFVTGDALSQISHAAGEPCVCILVPTSPMPMTGYTMCVPKSKVIDLNITIEQAFQFIVSCGVLVPSEQRLSPVQLELFAKSGRLTNSDQDVEKGHDYALGKMLVDKNDDPQV